MSDVAIICEGLGKQYRIGERERYKALRDVLTDAATAPFRRLRHGLRRAGDAAAEAKPTIWALQDVSFEIKRGEVVGVIGRNGAGKSTLLKILSRITEPTTGCARIYGRIGSLLEVGTGFHPELTGRENIYLNGAILGMKKAEIARKFDEIVAFAEVEKFIDTPVKRYSSGMYVRLAFAVAAHMETEILLVDEVLAVGDAQFQKKCFEKFRQISTGGRTILFVSHNMAAMRSVCEKGIVLDSGGVVDEGEINRIADRYLTTLVRSSCNQTTETASFLVERVSVRSLAGSAIKTFDDVELVVQFKAKTHIVDPGMYVIILTPDNERVAALVFNDFTNAAGLKAGESCQLGFRIDSLPLLAGEYQVAIEMTDLGLGKEEPVSERYLFEVVEAPIYGGRKVDWWFGRVGLRADAFSRMASADRDSFAISGAE